MIGNLLSWKNAWRIHIITLSLIVITVGTGTQVLVNAFAANTGILTLTVSASSARGRMTDGNWTHPGACSVSSAQFPLGTIIALYNTDGSFNRQCTAENAESNSNFGHIELAMPGNQSAVKQWGTRTMSAQILRWGWGDIAPTFSSTSSSGIKPSAHKTTKPVLPPVRPAPRSQ